MSDLERTLQKELNEILEKSTISARDINNYKNKHILVISGGGVKGIMAVGALKALKEYGCLEESINTYAGTSIGGLICLLLSIGYTIEELHDLVIELDFTKLKSIKLDNLLFNYGLDAGNKFEIIIKKMLHGKNISDNVTFKELYEKTDKKLIVTATCLNDKQAVYWSYDTTPEMSVLMAIRMTISIPIYFVPVHYKNKIYVDGACIDNYPIQLFNDRLDDVIGIYLTDYRDKSTVIENIESYLFNLLQSLAEGVTCNSIKGYEKCTLRLAGHGTGLTDININQDKKIELYNIGYNTVKEMFTT